MSFENDYAIYKLSEGILYVIYKHIEVDLPMAVYIVKDRLELQKGQILPVLCDIRQIKGITKAARVYLSLEGSAFIKAVAFIVDSPLSDSLSAFYLQTSNPIIPTKAFGELDSALRFLETYK